MQKKLRAGVLFSLMFVAMVVSVLFGGSGGCGCSSNGTGKTDTANISPSPSPAPVAPSATGDQPSGSGSASEQSCKNVIGLELDPDFADAGLFSMDFGQGKPDLGNSIAVQADGKILVSGYVNWSGVGVHDARLGLVRLDTDGTLDSSFGNNGVVIIDSCHSFWGVQWWALHGLALQSDGKILVGGDCSMRAEIFRLDTNGSIDAGFGTGGSAFIAADVAGGNWSAVFSLATQIDDDGKENIIVGGIANTINDGSWGVEPVWLLARFDENGQLDNSFGGQRSRPDDPAPHPGMVMESWGTHHNDGIRDLIVLDDGSIIAYGNSSRADSQLNVDFAVARFTPDGKLDTGFGLNGLTTIDFGGNDWAYSISLGLDGKLIGGAHVNCCWETSRAGLFSLNEDGSIDTSFGVNGKATIDMGLGHQSFGNSVVVLPDGTIILGGYANNGLGITDQVDWWLNDDFGIAVIDRDGASSTTFRTDFYGKGDGINSIALTDEVFDGTTGDLLSFKIVAAGTTIKPPRIDQDFAIARYRSVITKVCTSK